MAGDDAPSDRLVVSTGALTGTTAITVNNLSGTGALTTQNGIQVVEANLCAISSATAFTLGQPLSAGAYQYYLFKGGVTAGSENSWYLRSAVVAAPAAVPPVVPPVEPGEPPVTPPVPPPSYRPLYPPSARLRCRWPPEAKALPCIAKKCRCTP